MSEKKQNGGQQPSVEVKSEVVFYDYIVCDKLEEIDNELYYKLSLETLKEHKYLYIEVSKIVLAPNLIISISSNTLENGDIIHIEAFDENTCFRLIEKYGNCFYSITSSKVEIIFPNIVKELNNSYSGKVMLDVSDYNSCSYSSSIGTYEIKLDRQIYIKSIERAFKKIYVPSYDLLNGFEVKNLKIDPESLFDCDHTSSIDKPKLLAKYAKKEDIISEKDKWLLKKVKFYKIFTKLVKYISFTLILSVIVLSILTTSETFVISLVAIMNLAIAYIVYVFISDKVKILDNIMLEKKYDIDKVFRYGNIKGTMLSLFVILFFLYSYSVLYKYDTNYVYDSVKKEFLDSNSFVVDKTLVFNKDKILDRYIPVINNYSIDLLYKDPNSLLTFSNKFIDLEINIKFKEGKFLLGDDMSRNLLKIKTIFQKNISKGLYGDLSTMNTYEYRKVLIDIEQDFMNLLTASLKQKKLIAENIVDKITITTKYAKLQNID